MNHFTIMQGQLLRESSTLSESSSSSPSSSLPSTMKNMVSFAKCAIIQFTLHISDYTESEKEACFYDREEVLTMKKDAKRIARMVIKKGKNNYYSDDDDIRGIEHLISKEQKMIQCHHRENAIVAVIKEQFFRNKKEPDSDQRIAAIYSQMSRESVIFALFTGLVDESYVKNNGDNNINYNHNENAKLFELAKKQYEQQQSQQPLESQTNFKDVEKGKKKKKGFGRSLSLSSLLLSGKKKTSLHLPQLLKKMIRRSSCELTVINGVKL